MTNDELTETPHRVSSTDGALKHLFTKMSGLCVTPKNHWQFGRLDPGLSMTSILSSAKTQSAPEWILGTKGHREFWKTSRWGAVSLGNVAIPDKSRGPRENPVICGQFGRCSLIFINGCGGASVLFLITFFRFVGKPYCRVVCIHIYICLKKQNR